MKKARKQLVRLIAAYMTVAVLALLLAACKKQSDPTEHDAQGTVIESEPISEPPEESSEESSEGPPEEDSSEESKEEPKEPSGDSGFDVSGPKWNWIDWDMDSDGETEEICFEYQDLGDEAPSYIQITLYDGNEQLEEIIDRAYGLIEVLPMEDTEGTYLQIRYMMGDYYAHDAEGQCTLRMREKQLEVVYNNEE